MENTNKTAKALTALTIIKKINAILSLICTALILVHGTYDSVWMMLRGKIGTLPAPLAYVLVVLIGIHAVVSIVCMILGRLDTTKKEVSKVEKIKTLVQRISGFGIIALLVLHIIGMKQHLAPEILHSILHPIFFLVVYVHTAISFSKALTTLGVTNQKVIKASTIGFAALCVIILIASIVGLYLVMYAPWLG